MAAFEEINGVTLVTGATRAETGFTMQSSDAASYFCANGLAIVIYERTDGEAGCTVSCHCGPGTLGVLFVRK